MSKITLNNLVNLTNQTSAVTTINGNNTALQTAFDNTLSRDGTSPNQMSATLDMNSNRIINLPSAVSVSEPVTLSQMTAALVSNGNINTGLTGVPVSIAMQPVVNSSTTTAALALLGGLAVSTFTNIAALRGNNPNTSSVVYAFVQGYYTLLDGGGGWFLWSSSLASADNSGTIINPTGNFGSGRWVRVVDELNVFNVTWFGAVGDGNTDDTTAIQKTINAALAASTYPYASLATVEAPPGHNYKISSGLTVPGSLTGINFNFQSPITYYGTSGIALTIASSVPTPYFTQCDIFFKGFIAANGNSNVPTAVNPAGTTGIQINSMTFCNVRVGLIQGFTNRGVYLNGTGDLFTEVIQHCRFDFGQVVYNGLGIFANSTAAATSSVEANFFQISDIYGNLINIQCDDATHNATTSNYFLIDAMDDSGLNANGGHGILNYGNFNRFDLTYLGGTVTTNDVFWAGASDYNTFNVYNPAVTGPRVTNGSTGTHNKWNIIS